ncbi:MAG TPA: YbjQ family protein [Nitrososphaerales archaeon]
MKCGKETSAEASYCQSCGNSLKGGSVNNVASPALRDFLTVTTPTLPGFKIVKILGVAHGMTARTRGLGGKIIGGLQNILGGEVSAFTFEIEKAKDEALERIVTDAKRMGANAVIGLDFETTEVFETVVLVSLTGTAVVVEKEVK